jgi:hypothetical protein
MMRRSTIVRELGNSEYLEEFPLAFTGGRFGLECTNVSNLSCSKSVSSVWGQSIYNCDQLGTPVRYVQL